MITGKDLIKLGYKPNRHFGRVLSYINDNNLQHDEMVEYLKTAFPRELKMTEVPAEVATYIDPENDVEKNNFEKVKESMGVLMHLPNVIYGQVMPDACPAGPVGTIPVGGVVCVADAIYPSMHSADICCSVFTSYFPENTDPIKLLDSAQDVTHFGGGGREEHSYLPVSLARRIMGNSITKNFLNIAVNHMGTQGDGNHFLFVGRDKVSGKVCLVTHHGSRGFGAKVYKTGMQVAEAFRKELAPTCLKSNPWIPFNTVEGKEYWDALQVVRLWTKENHRTIHDAVAHNARVDSVKMAWNEHNFVFKKGDFFFHAKGATPVDDSIRVIDDEIDATGLSYIPLNMSQPILVAEKDQKMFAPHGAGRNVSRSEHIRSIGERELEDVLREETEGIDVRFFSGHPDLSELPSAYKNADAVRQQIEKYRLANIVSEIEPIGCIMAGDWMKNKHWRKK